MHRLTLTLLLVTSACADIRGSGVSATVDRELAAFTSLENHTQVDVRIHPEGSTPAKLTCDDNVLDLIRTEVRAGTLIVDTEPGTSFSTTVPCALDVQATQLVRLVVTGSGKVDATGPFPGLEAVSNSGSGDLSLIHATGGALAVTNTGSGAVALDDTVVDALTVSSSGSGPTSLGGSADTATVTTSGSGAVNLSGFAVATATVSASGSGNTTVRASTSVSGTSSGSGDVIVLGGAAVSVSTTGSGKVREE